MVKRRARTEREKIQKLNRFVHEARTSGCRYQCWMVGIPLIVFEF
jgi:hypothetical protein